MGLEFATSLITSQFEVFEKAVRDGGLESIVGGSLGFAIYIEDSLGILCNIENVAELH